MRTPDLPQPTLEEIRERIHYLQRQLELGRRILAQDLSAVGRKLATDWEFEIRLKLIEASREEDRLMGKGPAPRKPGYLGDVAGLGCDPDVL